MITIEFIVIILCLLIGTRFGGMGLGLISGIGLFVLSFVFGLQPGKPPVDVMLTILAVIGCAATLQTAGGLNVMMQFAERLLRKHPQHITLLAPFTTWMLTFLCGTGHVVYTMFPIIADIALKKGIRPERPMAVASVASQMAITASPVSVAVVSLVSILGAQHGIGHAVWRRHCGTVELASREKPRRRSRISGKAERSETAGVYLWRNGDVDGSTFPETGLLVHVDLLRRDCRSGPAGCAARAASGV